MNNKIDERLRSVLAEKRPALMAHAIVGYPSLDATKALVKGMEKAGVDLVELQIPFSDPLADGPTIQKACEQALNNGVRVNDAFAVASSLSRETELPLLFMTYSNIVYKYGVEKFCADAARAGISGLIVPDLPLEAAAHEGLLTACKRYGLHNILTLAPTSTVSRLQKNRDIASGFVYCMSRQGVTGTQHGLDPDLEQYIRRVRRHMQAPLAVGFGISNVQRLRAVSPYADIVVVGSAIIDKLAGEEPKKALSNALDFIATLAKEVRSPRADKV